MSLRYIFRHSAHHPPYDVGTRSLLRRSLGLLLLVEAPDPRHPQLRSVVGGTSAGSIRFAVALNRLSLTGIAGLFIVASVDRRGFYSIGNRWDAPPAH